jgi:hypothetical protein
MVAARDTAAACGSLWHKQHRMRGNAWHKRQRYKLPRIKRPENLMKDNASCYFESEDVKDKVWRLHSKEIPEYKSQNSTPPTRQNNSTWSIRGQYAAKKASQRHTR